MTEVYPAPRTGTAQDLFGVVTRAYELELKRAGARLPPKNDWQRRWIEPFFRVLGIVVAKLMEIIPADAAVAIHDRMFAALAGGRFYPFDASDEKVQRARALSVRLETAAGAAPALLALVSHSPVLGESAHLNFELVRRASAVLRAVRGHPCRPRLVVAIDPFALDTASIVEEGLYAGFMGSYHIGIDRLALGRGDAGPALTPQTSWAAMPMRLLRLLGGGGEVGLVLSGGVPATARVLYGVREWVQRARAKGRGACPKESVFFNRMAREVAEVMPLPRADGRVVEAWLMAVAAGVVPAEGVEAAAAQVLSCLAVPEGERGALLAEFSREIARETPLRRRLFRLLAARVVPRRPIVFLPVVHRMDPFGVEMREAWSWESLGRGRVLVRRADTADAATEMTPETFAERFVEENFA